MALNDEPEIIQDEDLAADFVVELPPPNNRAPELRVPAASITCVEHPFIVRNVTKAIQSLGGGLRLEKVLEQNGPLKAIGLRLRPGDTLSRPILSQVVPTNDVVIRVTLPKRTGRRRRRGSTGDYVEYNKQTKTREVESGRELFRNLKDNSDKAIIQPIGVVWESFRFRNLPDFQYDTGKDSLMNRMRDNLLTYDYSKLRQFDIDTQFGFPEDCDVGPPAAFCHLNSQFNYGYEQNPSIRTLEDGHGGQVTVNLQAMRGHITHVVTLDDPTVPDQSPVPLAPKETLHPDLQKAIHDLERIMADRPIISRRVSRNLADKATVYCQRFAWSYVGYVFKSGPWKDCLIKFGLDPRKDPACRKYQVMSFQFTDMAEDEQVHPPQAKVESLPTTESSSQSLSAPHDLSHDQPIPSLESKLQPHPHVPLASQDPQQQVSISRPKQKLVDTLAGPTSHIFNGKSAHLDGKTWQLCDVLDPTLRRILDTDDIASTPDLHGGNGWFKNGFMVVFRAMMRDKVQSLISGSIPDEETYEPFLSWPATIEDESTPQLRLPTDSSMKQMALAFEIRVKLSSTVTDKDKEKEKQKHHAGGGGVGASNTSGNAAEPAQQVDLMDVE